MLELGTKLVSADHPEWGTWTVTEVPNWRDNWYTIKGESGERVLHTSELHFWMKVMFSRSRFLEWIVSCLRRSLTRSMIFLLSMILTTMILFHIDTTLCLIEIRKRFEV